MSIKDVYYPFETLARAQIRRLRRFADRMGPALSYLNQDGDNQPVQGDEFGPFVQPVGLASSDGETGAQEVLSGQRQLPLFDLFGKLFSVPAPLLTDQATLLADVACAAAGAFTATSVLDVSKYRRINLSIRYTPGAAGGYPYIVPLRTSVSAQPAVTADNWYGFGVNNGVPTSTVITGAFPAGTDPTIQPGWGLITEYPLAIRLETGVANTDKLRMDLELDVTSVNWLYFLYAEKGVVGTPGTLGLRYNLSM